MRVRKLDEETGDIVTNGDIWKRDAEAIAQNIKTRLKLFLGEYFRDITEGVPWFEREDGTAGILVKGVSQAEVESNLRNRILRTDGVIKILTFGTAYAQQERRFVVEASVLTEYGEASIIYGTTV